MTGRLTIRLAALGGLAALPLLAACEMSQPLPTLTYAERPCYRTLAEVDCHSRVLPGEESRRVGFYDEPISIKQNESWPQRLF